MIDRFSSSRIPVLGFAAFSGTGKTSLLEQLIPALVGQGLDIGLIKLSHHDFDIDVPGKDSDRLRKAGARQTLLASPWRQAWIREAPGAHAEPRPDELLERLDTSELDLVLVEGGREWPIPKIELHRGALGKPLLCVQDANIIAVASDQALVDPPDPVVRLDINNVAAIATFILGYFGLTGVDPTRS